MCFAVEYKYILCHKYFPTLLRSEARAALGAGTNRTTKSVRAQIMNSARF